MDFKLSDEQMMFKETARKFSETEISPLIRQMEEHQRTPRELIKKMRDLSFYGVQYPAEYGGVGSTYLEYVMVIEELSRVYCSIGGHISVNCLCAGTINDFGTVEQKKKYLPALVQGDAVGSFAFTEPSTGSDPGAIRTTCVREGDNWVINGEKIFITNSTLPGYIVLFCKDVEKDNKITNIIVPKDAKGYSTPELVEKMGMHGMEVADVVLEDVRVPFENTTGGEAGRGKGFSMLTSEIAIGKLGFSAECLGYGSGRFRGGGEVRQGKGPEEASRSTVSRPFNGFWAKCRLTRRLPVTIHTPRHSGSRRRRIFCSTGRGQGCLSPSLPPRGEQRDAGSRRICVFQRIQH